jgi:hypothetical protein
VLAAKVAPTDIGKRDGTGMYALVGADLSAKGLAHSRDIRRLDALANSPHNSFPKQLSISAMIGTNRIDFLINPSGVALPPYRVNNNF